MSENTEKTLDEVLDLIRKQHVAMLTTVLDGQLVSRPMGMQEPDRDGILWFFVLTDSDVADQVRANPEVNVALAQKDYVSVTGTGEVVFDPAMNKRLWSSAVEAWMQVEPDDPQCSLIRVTPSSIGYWDTPNAAVSAVKMIAGVVRGEQPDVGDSGVIEAGQTQV